MEQEKIKQQIDYIIEHHLCPKTPKGFYSCPECILYILCNTFYSNRKAVSWAMRIKEDGYNIQPLLLDYFL